MRNAPGLAWKTSRMTWGIRMLSSQYQPKPWESIYTTEPKSNDKTFDKILIANRGEIAVRIIRTARKMGIATVAVHSVVDSNSLFVKMADESVNIGPPAAKDSYLRMDKILKAVEMTGAEAVHPGYGFLSENTAFVAELEKQKVAFIGPNSEAIKGMGDKLASKRLATKAGVNGIPGYDGVIRDADECVKLSREIGYPVMIKASAGGGGKGMRIAHNDAEAKEAFKLCSEEGAAFFGDDRMLVEKFIDQPRHIEIQVLGDKHGNAIHLNERECSIQRRNQKVIEEAPSPFLDQATRNKMGKQAVDLAKAIGYDSAGTVEFLVDSEKNFYFLEMNTRLQVEHPITECITGVDLVRQMIRSSAGIPLNLKQEDIKINGWAVENRVYAEDPFKNFGMPSIGRLYAYQEPKDIPGVRCDSGIEEGSEISMHYDPMICKLTTYAPNRDQALNLAVKAIDSYVIRGVTHNIPLLRDILEGKGFRSGNFTTNFLPETYPNGFPGKVLSEEEAFHVAMFACTFYAKESLRASRRLSDKSLTENDPTGMKEWDLVAIVREKKIPVKLSKIDGAFVAHSGQHRVTIDDNFTLSDLMIKANLNGIENITQLIVRYPNSVFRIRYHGTALNVPVLPATAAKVLDHMKEKPKVDMSKVILSPMPGVVKDVSVTVGQKIGEGLECCIVEAMKMQNIMRSTVFGTVKAVHVKPGDTVEEDQLLIELE